MAKPYGLERMAPNLPALYPIRDRSQQVPQANGTTTRMKEAHVEAKSTLILLGAFVALTLLPSCSKPQQEIDEAKAAVEAAGTAGASIYSAAEWARLNKHLAAALAKVHAQAKKPVKDYGTCKALLGQVLADAEALAASLPELKQRAKNRATEAMAKAEAAVEEAGGLLERAPISENVQLVIDSSKTSLFALEEALGQAQEAIAIGDYFGALDLSKAIRDDAIDLSDELRLVIRMSRRDRQPS